MGRPPAWDIIEQVQQQKLNYYQKTLTDDAIFSNLSTTIDIFDSASFFADFTLSDTLFSSLMSYFIFDLNLNDIIPVNLNFEIELPSIDEFLQGVLIKLIPISLQDLAPELSDILSDPLGPLNPSVADAMKETKLEKCIYGKSSYGNCYVDPATVREFLRSTVFAFMKKWYDLKSAREMVSASAKTLNINEDVARDIFNRLSKITHIKYSCATVDYSWVDFTTICEEESHSPQVGVLTYINYDLAQVSHDYEDVFDAQAGCIADESLVDYCSAVGEVEEEKHPYLLGDTRLVQIQDKIWSNFRNRFTTTAFAVGNYQRPEERRYPFINERMEIYAQNRGFAVQIENLVRNIVQSIAPDTDPVTMRMYQNAVLEIYGLSSPHKWGLEMQRSMSQDEYKQYWLEKWTRYGLDPDILNELWSRTISVVQRYSDIRTETRLRFLRNRLRLVK